MLSRSRKYYQEGAEFTVYVDHNPLTYLLLKPNLNRWQVRILEVLAMYPGMKIQHIQGKDNIADGLSRIHYGPPPPATSGPAYHCYTDYFTVQHKRIDIPKVAQV